MIKRIARIAVISAGAVLLAMTLIMVWLKVHEDELVFAAAVSRQHLLSTLPANAELTAVPIAKSPDLAGLVFRADADVGGHVDALFEHVNGLQAALAGLIPGLPPPRAP